MAMEQLDPAVKAETLRIAEDALAEGNLDLADRACRELEVRGADCWRTWLIVHELAARLSRRDVAELAVGRAESDKAAEGAALAGARARLAALPDAAAPTPRGYHVIRAWGQGFWSDVDHVLGQVVVAEWMGRTPIVAWGANSRFGGESLPRGRSKSESDPGVSAWDWYFRPVSEARLPDVLGKKHRYFPAKFNDRNLTALESGAMEGPGSRVGALSFLGRGEEVTVSDFHTPLVALRNWTPAWHRHHGRTLTEMYEDVVSRYLTPTPEMQARADAAAVELGLENGPVVAVLVRGSDKTQELIDLHSVHAMYQQHLMRAMRELGPSTRVFLLTDWAPAEAEYRARLGSRLIVARRATTSEATGLHFQAGRSGRQLGEEVLVDVLLAARCTAFIGLGYSNVSAFAAYFRGARLGAAAKNTLIGPHLHEMYNLPLLRHRRDDAARRRI